MIHIALILALFMLVIPSASYGAVDEATPLAGQGGAKAGQETIRSGIAGQVLEEKERQQEKAKQEAGRDSAGKRSKQGRENPRPKP